MDEPVPFGSHVFNICFVLLLFARGMDILSTRIATPNLLLEANPLARKLGWTYGIIFNFIFCVGFAFWPLSAVIIATTSVLVAARNFQLAWLMRTMGEDNYRAWFSDRLGETPPSLFIFCLLAQTILTGFVGGALLLFTPLQEWIPIGIGVGVVGYAAAVLFFTGLALWRSRRAARLR